MHITLNMEILLFSSFDSGLISSLKRTSASSSLVQIVFFCSVFLFALPLSLHFCHMLIFIHKMILLVLTLISMRYISCF
jgi:hypothetical protein